MGVLEFRVLGFGGSRVSRVLGLGKLDLTRWPVSGAVSGSPCSAPSTLTELLLRNWFKVSGLSGSRVILTRAKGLRVWV